MLQIPPEYQKVTEVATFSGVIALVVGIARNVITQNYQSWFGFLVELTASIIIAILIGLVLDNTTFSIVTKSGIIGICAFIARDIIDIVKKIRDLMLNDPFGTIKEILNLLRGK